MRGPKIRYVANEAFAVSSISAIRTETMRENHITVEIQQEKYGSDSGRWILVEYSA